MSDFATTEILRFAQDGTCQTVFDKLLEGPEGTWQGLQHVAGDERDFADRLRRQVSRQTVQIDSGRDRIRDGSPPGLRQQPCHEAGQNISGPARSHAGIAGGIHPHFPARRRGQGARPFEHQRHAALAGELSRQPSSSKPAR